MKSKDTIDKLNMLEFFYWIKPPKTPEVLEQDKETVERDFALIRKDLEMLEFIKTHYEMNGFNELIPKYDEVDKFSELEE